MMRIDRLTVRYHGEVVGTLLMTPDEKLCAFEYDKAWFADGFSVSPLELPLRHGLFIAKPLPLYGNFGVFEDRRTTRHFGKRNWSPHAARFHSCRHKAETHRAALP